MEEIHTLLHLAKNDIACQMKPLSANVAALQTLLSNMHTRILNRAENP
jgi:hypothetical protein